MIARVSRSKKSSPRPSRADGSADEECRNSRNTAELGPMQEQYIPSRLPTPVRASNHQPENFLITHADIKRFIKRYSSLLKWSTAIGILLGAAYAGTAVPLYTAHAQIIIDPSLPKSLTDTRDNIFGIDNAQVESQIQIAARGRSGGRLVGIIWN